MTKKKCPAGMGRLSFGERCLKCRERIEGNGIPVPKGLYHWECFWGDNQPTVISAPFNKDTVDQVLDTLDVRHDEKDGAGS